MSEDRPWVDNPTHLGLHPWVLRRLAYFQVYAIDVTPKSAEIQIEFRRQCQYNIDRRDHKTKDLRREDAMPG